MENRRPGRRNSSTPWALAARPKSSGASFRWPLRAKSAGSQSSSGWWARTGVGFFWVGCWLSGLSPQTRLLTGIWSRIKRERLQLYTYILVDIDIHMLEMHLSSLLVNLLLIQVKAVQGNHHSLRIFKQKARECDHAPNDGEYVLTKYPKTRERTSTVTFQFLDLVAGRGRKGKLCLAMEENRTVYYSAAPLWTYLQC